MQSNTVNEVLNTFQKSAETVINNQSSSQAAQTKAINSLYLTSCPTLNVIHCGVIANQYIHVTQNANFMATFKTKDDINNLITQIVQNFVEQKNEMDTGFLAIAFSDQSQGQQLASKITQIVTTKITNNQYNTMLAQCQGLNEEKFLLCGTWDCTGTSGFDFNQDIVLKQTSRMLTVMAAEAALQDQNVQNVVQKASQEQSSKQAGLNDLIADLGLFMILPIVIILAIVFLPGMLAGKGKTDAKTPNPNMVGEVQKALQKGVVKNKK